MGTCSGCSNTWTGTKQCHCSSCHSTFSVESNFDKHRVGKSLPLSCVHPSDAGLEQNPRGIWKQPGEVDVYERMKGDAISQESKRHLD